MNNAHFIKNMRLNFNPARSLIPITVLAFVYFTIPKMGGELATFNLLVAIVSTLFVALGIYNSVIQEVNAGTWSYVVTSRMNPFYIVTGQVLGAMPTMAIVAVLTFILQIYLLPSINILLVIAFGSFMVSISALMGFWQSIEWEKRLYAGKSEGRIHSLLNIVSIIVFVMIFLLFYRLGMRQAMHLGSFYWFYGEYGQIPFIISTFFFFSVVNTYGCVRNVQRAMKIRLTPAYWLFSACCIITFVLGFTFVGEESIYNILDRILPIHGSLLNVETDMILNYIGYLRSHIVYQLCLIFLLVSVLFNPLNPSVIRNLSLKFRSGDWKEFFVVAPASLVNSLLLLIAFTWLSVSHFTFEGIELLDNFTNSLYYGTCTGTFLALRDALVFWIFSRLFLRRAFVVFVAYCLGVWFVIPTFMAQVFGLKSTMTFLFWPFLRGAQSFDQSSVIVSFGEMCVALFTFFYLQSRIRVKTTP